MTCSPPLAVGLAHDEGHVRRHAVDRNGDSRDLVDRVPPRGIRHDRRIVVEHDGRGVVDPRVARRVLAHPHAVGDVALALRHRHVRIENARVRVVRPALAVARRALRGVDHADVPAREARRGVELNFRARLAEAVRLVDFACGRAAKERKIRTRHLVRVHRLLRVGQPPMLGTAPAKHAVLLAFIASPSSVAGLLDPCRPRHVFFPFRPAFCGDGA